MLKPPRLQQLTSPPEVPTDQHYAARAWQANEPFVKLHAKRLNETKSLRNRALSASLAYAQCSTRKENPPGRTRRVSNGRARRSLALGEAGTGIPMRIRVERPLRDPPADDRQHAVTHHHEHFARAEFAMFIQADETAADDRAEREAADRGQAVPLGRELVGVGPAIVEAAVSASQRDVGDHHAATGDDLASHDVRAAVLEQEGLRGAALRKQAERRSSH